MRHRFDMTPAGLLTAAYLLLNILVIAFAITTHSIWLIFLGFTVPLLWWSMLDVIRSGRDSES